MSAVDPIITQQMPPLLESEAAPDPLVQFQHWYRQACDAKIPHPEAMTLATCSPGGKPSARMVLLRGFDDRGFVFYTNYQSRKAKELQANPFAALVFYWEPLARQVRIEGKAECVSEQESDVYFASRPRGSQLGAWASPQSDTLAGRDELERNFDQLIEIYAEHTQIPRPRHWGGYRLIPSVIEFWQGRPNRLHDRLCYRREATSWKVQRLAP